MKKFFLPMLMVGLIALSACNNPKKGSVNSQEAQEVASAEGATLLSVDPAASVVKWKGSKVVGGGHHGVVKVKSGELQLDGENITGGKVVIDMNSIANEDVEGDGKAQLEGHLKSADFFDVEQFPEASFEVTSIQKNADSTYNVSGNLTIKDVTKNISVKASLTDGEQAYIIDVPLFTFDRTEWNVVYGSSKLTDIAKDAVIKDEIELEVQLVVNK